MSIGTVRAGYFPAGPGQLGAPTLLVVGVDAVLLIGDNPHRSLTWIENRGPGVVYLAPNQQVTNPKGIQLPVNAVLVDDPPITHKGEWWAIADAADTQLLVVERT
jgi:hypothetical protein